MHFSANTRDKLSGSVADLFFLVNCFRHSFTHTHTHFAVVILGQFSIEIAKNDFPLN